MANILKEVYLNNFHKENSAKFVNFAGYSMPINYSLGIINEHIHTRKSAGVFDVSHMGQILIPIKNNQKRINKYIPIDFDNFKINRSYYSFFLNERGGIIDDIIISKIKFNNDFYYFIVYNSSRKSVNESIFKDNFKDYIIIDNNSFLAVQGPKSESILKNIFIECSKLNFMDIEVLKYKNFDVFISRTGYTGEDGFEISIPNKLVYNFINKLFKFDDIILCGLGSRDSLRIEAGLSLYGNELNQEMTPVESGLSWALNQKRIINQDFNGSNIIINQIKNGVKKKKVGLKAITKSILRNNMEIYCKNEIIGKITSGGYSPTLNCSVAIAYLNKNFLNINEKIYCILREKEEEVKLCNLPFVKHNYFKGDLNG